MKNYRKCKKCKELKDPYTIMQINGFWICYRCFDELNAIFYVLQVFNLDNYLTIR
jgi:hypothetical protein